MLQKWFQNIILKYKIALLAFFYFLNLNVYANLKKKCKCTFYVLSFFLFNNNYNALKRGRF